MVRWFSYLHKIKFSDDGFTLYFKFSNPLQVLHPFILCNNIFTNKYFEIYMEIYTEGKIILYSKYKQIYLSHKNFCLCQNFLTLIDIRMLKDLRGSRENIFFHGLPIYWISTNFRGSYWTFVNSLDCMWLVVCWYIIWAKLCTIALVLLLLQMKQCTKL